MQLQSEHTSTCWVFVRHSECIQVSTRELSVTIDGPHRTHDRYHFDCERDLQSFQMTLAEQLTERGWLLCASKSL
ncbi:MAG TPA: hypothetical protein VFS23_12875 [Vicinamibacterales bacterium]|nr:hypothetical protein [Vicinamibacterales bacterium]